jgi:hypothetical protein
MWSRDGGEADGSNRVPLHVRVRDVDGAQLRACERRSANEDDPLMHGGRSIARFLAPFPRMAVSPPPTHPRTHPHRDKRSLHGLLAAIALVAIVAVAAEESPLRKWTLSKIVKLASPSRAPDPAARGTVRTYRSSRARDTRDCTARLGLYTTTNCHLRVKKLASGFPTFAATSRTSITLL